MLWGLQLDKLAIERVNRDLEIPYLIDPAAGSGTFLIEYMKFITNNLKRRFKDKLANKRDVENIGYKRTKRGEKPMPNELYRTNDKGEVLVDDKIIKTALDYMRKIEWD